MKRCPICHRTFAAEALKFCRHDGALLHYEVPGASEFRATLLKLPRHEDFVPTAVFPSGQMPSGPTETSGGLTTPLSPQRRSRRSKVIDSLAVLPLANASTDQQMEYLSEGSTE